VCLETNERNMLVPAGLDVAFFAMNLQTSVVFQSTHSKFEKNPYILYMYVFIVIYAILFAYKIISSYVN